MNPWWVVKTLCVFRGDNLRLSKERTWKSLAWKLKDMPFTFTLFFLLNHILITKPLNPFFLRKRWDWWARYFFSVIHFYQLDLRPFCFLMFWKKKRTKSSIKMNKMMWETLKFTLLYTFLHIIILLPILQINHLQVQKRTQNPRIAFGYCSTGSLKTFIHYFGIRKETQSSLYSRHFCANFDPQSILHPRYAHSRNYPWKSTLEVLGGNKT